MNAKRRIDVMLSSTFLDLKDHRAAIFVTMHEHQLTPVAMEFGKALPDADTIDASLAMVDRSDAYIGVIGSRYGKPPVCAERNPEKLSLTELEYRRAVERGLPRLMFIMAGSHPLTLNDLEAAQAEGEDGRRMRLAFIERVRADRVAADFLSLENFKLEATKAVPSLKEPPAPGGSGPTPPMPPPSPDDVPPTAAPAFHYVRKPYIENRVFAGRTSELNSIDEWAVGGDAMLLFHAIGGMGKSMLTWHWLKARSTTVRDGWAGRFWYSFYEQGADLNDFCVHALAYIRNQPPKTFRGRRTLELGAELLRELDAKPCLLVLDGLERVLVAYNRSGKDRMTDDEAEVVRDDLGLDRAPRDCFRPEDDDVLAMLAQSAKGKLLITSRLTPAILTSSPGQPIPGVKYVGLTGLAPEDAEQVLRNAGVRGDGWRMRHYLAHNFECHPLSVGVVAGQVLTYLESRGDFDRWAEDSRGGADPLLITGELRGRQNHILARAFEDLDDDAKALLGSIAIASLELTIEIVRLLNPMRPIEPVQIDRPEERLTPRQLYERTADPDVMMLYHSWSSAAEPEQEAKLSRALDEYIEKDFNDRLEAHGRYLEDLNSWKSKADCADCWLLEVLPDLEARGLLQYDASKGSLDMHPAIRHTALVGLAPDVRGSTGSHVSDALSSRPVVPFRLARTLQDLALVKTRVEALNAAGRLVDGWDLLVRSGLDDVLWRLGYSHDHLELMQPYFPNGWERGATMLEDRQQVSVLASVSIALSVVGRHRVATATYQRLIESALDDGVLDPFHLGNFAVDLERQGRRLAAERIATLALRLSKVKSEFDEEIWLRINLADSLLERGCLDEGEAQLAELRREIEAGHVDPLRSAELLLAELLLARLQGRLHEVDFSSVMQKIRKDGTRSIEISALNIFGSHFYEVGDYGRAVQLYEDLISICNDIGDPSAASHEARRAASLAALDRVEDARRVATKVDRGNDPPHLSLAELYLALDDRAKAASHARHAYTLAWGDGPPMQSFWDLKRCREILALLGEPEPAPPAVDPSNAACFEFEPAVERLIAQLEAEGIELTHQTLQ